MVKAPTANESPTDYKRGAHRFNYQPYEHGVFRGECSCGAVNFAPTDVGNDKFLARCEVLNKSEGKQVSHPVTNALVKEVSTVTQGQQTPIRSQPPPPRPDTSKLNLPDRNHAMHKYYEDNQAQIRSDLAVLGEADMLKKWNITHTTWNRMKYWIDPEHYGTKQVQTGTVQQPPAAPGGTDATPEQTRTVADLLSGNKRLEEMESHIDAVGEHVVAVERLITTLGDKVKEIDLGVSDLVNRGYVADEMVVDVVEALVSSDKFPDVRKKAEKIVAIVEAMKGV